MEENEFNNTDEFRPISNKKWLNSADVSMAQLDSVQTKVYNLGLQDAKVLKARGDGTHRVDQQDAVITQRSTAWGSHSSIPDLIRQQNERKKTRPESAKMLRRGTRPPSGKRRPLSAKPTGLPTKPKDEKVDISIGVKGARYDPSERPPQGGVPSLPGTAGVWMNGKNNGINDMNDQEIDDALQYVMDSQLQSNGISPYAPPPPVDIPSAPRSSPDFMEMIKTEYPPESPPPDSSNQTMDDLLAEFQRIHHPPGLSSGPKQASVTTGHQQALVNQAHEPESAVSTYSGPEQASINETPATAPVNLSPEPVLQKPISLTLPTEADDEEDSGNDDDTVSPNNKRSKSPAYNTPAKVDVTLDNTQSPGRRRAGSAKRKPNVQFMEELNQTLDITPRNVQRSQRSRPGSGRSRGQGSPRRRGKMAPVCTVAYSEEVVKSEEEEKQEKKQRRDKKLHQVSLYYIRQRPGSPRIRRPGIPEVDSMMSNLTFSDDDESAETRPGSALGNTVVVSSNQKNYYQQALKQKTQKPDQTQQESVKPVKTVRTLEFGDEGLKETISQKVLDPPAEHKKTEYKAPRPTSAKPKPQIETPEVKVENRGHVSGRTVERRPGSGLRRPKPPRPQSAISSNSCSSLKENKVNERPYSTITRVKPTETHDNTQQEVTSDNNDLDFGEFTENKQPDINSLSKNKNSDNYGLSENNSFEEDVLGMDKLPGTGSLSPNKTQDSVVPAHKKSPLRNSAVIENGWVGGEDKETHGIPFSKGCSHRHNHSGKSTHDMHHTHSHRSMTPKDHRKAAKYVSDDHAKGNTGVTTQLLRKTNDKKKTDYTGEFIEIWTRKEDFYYETEGLKECRELQDKLIDAGVPVTLDTLKRALLPPTEYGWMGPSYKSNAGPSLPNFSSGLLTKPETWLPEEHKRVMAARKLVREASASILEQEREERRRAMSAGSKKGKKAGKKAGKKSGKKGKARNSSAS